jgi:hypothetical protein
MALSDIKVFFTGNKPSRTEIIEAKASEIVNEFSLLDLSNDEVGLLVSHIKQKTNDLLHLRMRLLKDEQEKTQQGINLLKL